MAKGEIMNIFNVVSNFLLSEIGVLIGLGGVAVVFITCLIFALLGANYKHKITYITFSIFIALTYLSACVCANKNYFIVILIFSFIALLFCPLLLIKKDNYKEQKSLIKSIDENILGNLKEDNAQLKNDLSQETRQEILSVKAPKEKDESLEVDFSHVKNIISRLDYFSLSGADKKAVSNLENTIILAEQKGATKELKEKVNDGLSALLKIMSKYGV